MKSTVTITLDSDIIAEARKVNLNISGVLNAYLREHLNLPEVIKPESVITTEHEIAQMEARLADLRSHHKKISKGSVILE